MTMFKLFITSLLTLTFTLPVLAHSGPDHAHEESDASLAESTDKSTPETSGKRTFPGKGKAPHLPLSAYKPGEMLGWKLHVDEQLIADEALYEDVMAELRHQLYLVVKAVPEDKVEWLQTVPIWIELNNPYHSSAQYHPNKEWLKGHGYHPEKVNAVEISNARNFIRNWAHHDANTMLHELAHAYHDLKLGFDRPDVEAAYDKAMADGSYEKVQSIGGRVTRHYAATDHKEYFAEATEAFFGCNDYYPFVRPELKAHDPAIYDIIKEVWGVKR